MNLYFTYFIYILYIYIISFAEDFEYELTDATNTVLLFYGSRNDFLYGNNDAGTNGFIPDTLVFGMTSVFLNAVMIIFAEIQNTLDMQPNRWTQ